VNSFEFNSQACQPALPRPNTSPKFPTSNIYDLPLTNSPSPFKTQAWQEALQGYPGELPTIITNILRYGCLLGYEGPQRLILSRNLDTANNDPETMEKKITDDLHQQRIIQTETTPPTSPFMSSPLGFVPKPDGTWRRIHHLSHPPRRSTNDGIPLPARAIEYICLSDVYAMVRQAGKGCILLKKDIKDAFRNIPVAPSQQWLLGFMWKGKYYQERCLPFGLATAPFIFNLFAEAFHWILQSYLRIQHILHYLDDFIFALPALETIPAEIKVFDKAYGELTDTLGIPRAEKKDATGTCITVLGIEIDTVQMIARLPSEKLIRAIQATTVALAGSSISLELAEKLGGFLGFCAEVVQLGRVYMRYLWTFIAAYPPNAPKTLRRKIPPVVRSDLLWWKTMLPHFNGVRFLDEKARKVVHIYSDASAKGMGAFFFYGLISASDWKLVAESLPITQAFSALVQRDADVEFNINVFELAAIMLALQRWAPMWRHHQVVVHTDNFPSKEGLTRQTLKGEANAVLRKCLLEAAKFDIVVTPAWVAGSNNELADAISRFDCTTIANWCPHWQTPYDSLLLRTTGYNIREITHLL
jgi:hypothetical protein